MKTTKNKPMSDVIQANPGLLPLIMNNVPQAVFWKDRNLVYLGCNQAFADDAGFPSPEDVIGKTDFDMPWKAQAEFYRADDLRVIETNESKLHYEERQTTPDGSTIWLSTSKIPVHENGQVVAVLGMYEDVTTHKQAENAIHENEERFRRFAEATVEGLVFHEQGKIIDANPASLAMVGLTDIAEFIGRNLLEFVAPEFHEAVLQNMKLDITHSHEIECIRKDGTIFPVENITRIFKVGDQTIHASSIRDIPERKQAEEALQESRQILQLVMDNIPQTVFWKDRETLNYLGANRSFAEDAGFSSPQELVGKNDFDMPWKEQAEFYRADDKLVLDIGESKLNYEESQTSPTGEIAWLRTSKIPMRDANGNVFGVLGTYEDITARKQAEEEMRRLQGAMEQAGDGIALADLSGKVFYANPAWANMHGYTVDELLGKHLSIFHTQEQLEKEVIPFNEKAIATGGNTSEIGHARKDGTTFPTLMTVSVQKNKSGAPVGLIGTIRDITERKQSEDEMLQQREKFRTVADFTYDWEYWLDIDGKYAYISPSVKRITGYEVEDFMQNSHMFNDIVHPEDKHILDEHIHDFHAEHSDQMGEVEVRIIRADGGERWVGHICQPVYDANGTWLGRRGSNRDITEQKQLETQVQKALEKRGYQVQVGTEISQEVAAATELNELFERVVTLTKERLGYYHTQLLRYDPAQDAVVLINGYGKTGQKMLDGGHRMPMGSGLIGTAASTGETVMRSTLAEDPDWQPNPLLPETKGEIAVPIKWQDNVLGVLDVQSNQAGALAEDDRLMLEGLCGQIAIAMHSAELVEIVRQNEARLAEALKAARLANWDYDVEKDLFTFNDEFYSIFHTTAEKAGGYQLPPARYAELFVHPDDMEIVGVEIGKGLSSTERVYNTTIDHRVLYADGGIGYITVKLTVERDDNGKITRYYGANQDITERKLAEEALRINEARLAEALKVARLAHWEYDVEKDLFTFNDQFYSIFHTTAEKAGGYQLSSARYAELFVHPDDMEIVGVEIGKGLSSIERVFNTTIDHRILYADGGVGYITVKVTVERDENGKITRYFGANQDITEQRKAQEELAERLEEINRLYRGMSHEGWKTYRETAELPAGFMFDQMGTRPVEEVALADENLASVPMKVLGGEVVGTLAVASDPHNPTSTEDIAFIQKVSDQIALALESARLTAQTQFALAQSERLFEASSILTQSADLQELVAAVVTTLNIPAMNRALLSIFEYAPSGDIEQLTIIANWWNGSGHEVTPIGTRYSREVMRVMPMFVSPVPVFFDDTFDDERVDATTLELVVKKLNLRSVTVLPLYSANKQIGALVLEGEEPHHFTQQEIRLFSSLAPQIATVVENRRQFEQAQQQAEREAMLNAISQKIQSATSVEAVLQIAARELGRALDASKAVAQLSAFKRNGSNGNNGNGNNGNGHH